MCLLVCSLCCVVFFFKQKTSYEVCISDLSSDVCSSDLVPLQTGLCATVEIVVSDDDTAIALGSGSVPVLATPRLVALCEQAAVAAIDGELADGSTSDRKGVVKGKRGSDSDDIGGRGILQKTDNMTLTS